MFINRTNIQKYKQINKRKCGNRQIGTHLNILVVVSSVDEHESRYNGCIIQLNFNI